jgi:hypothetical protein
MTGTIDENFYLSDDADPSTEALQQLTSRAALIEQAKGVLIFRYAIGACTAYQLMEGWAVEAGVGIEQVAHTLVHEICQGEKAEPSNTRFVRWLEERLRQEFTSNARVPRPAPTPVTVAVDQSESSLDAVVEAARKAVRESLPLEITVAPGALDGLQRAQLLQRIALAVELAQAVAPGLDVRAPNTPPS